MKSRETPPESERSGQTPPPEEVEEINESLEDLFARQARDKFVREQLEGAVAHLYSENAELAELATKDHLTGLYNRKGFDEEIGKIVAEINAVEKHGRQKTIERVTIGHFDIDTFKDINDAHGHAGGDAILKAVADYFRGTVRASDIIARFGGDEIVIAFVNADEETIMRRFGFDPEKRKPAHISIETETPEGKITATLSGGLTEYKKREPIEDAIGRADKALYFSKKKCGRNAISLFEDIERKAD